MREVPPASECDAAGTSPCASPGVAGMGQPTQPSSQARRDQRAIQGEASVEGRAASTGEGGRGRRRRDGRTRMRGTPPREVCLASESRTRKRGPARSRRRCSGQYRKGFRPLVQERIQRVLAVKAVGPKDCSGSAFAVRLGCWWRRTASAARAQTRIGSRSRPATRPAEERAAAAAVLFGPRDGSESGRAGGGGAAAVARLGDGIDSDKATAGPLQRSSAALEAPRELRLQRTARSSISVCPSH